MLEQYPASFFLGGQGGLLATAIAGNDQVHS